MKKVDFSKELKIFECEQEVVGLSYSNRLSWQKQKCSGVINITESLIISESAQDMVDHIYAQKPLGFFLLCTK